MWLILVESEILAQQIRACGRSINEGQFAVNAVGTSLCGNPSSVIPLLNENLEELAYGPVTSEQMQIVNYLRKSLEHFKRIVLIFQPSDTGHILARDIWHQCGRPEHCHRIMPKSLAVADLIAALSDQSVAEPKSDFDALAFKGDARRIAMYAANGLMNSAEMPVSLTTLSFLGATQQITVPNGMYALASQYGIAYLPMTKCLDYYRKLQSALDADELPELHSEYDTIPVLSTPISAEDFISETSRILNKPSSVVADALKFGYYTGEASWPFARSDRFNTQYLSNILELAANNRIKLNSSMLEKRFHADGQALCSLNPSVPLSSNLTMHSTYDQVSILLGRQTLTALQSQRVKHTWVDGIDEPFTLVLESAKQTWFSFNPEPRRERIFTHEKVLFGMNKHLQLCDPAAAQQTIANIVRKRYFTHDARLKPDARKIVQQASELFTDPCPAGIINDIIDGGIDVTPETPSELARIALVNVGALTAVVKLLETNRSSINQQAGQWTVTRSQQICQTYHGQARSKRAA